MKLSQFKFKLPEERVALYPHYIERTFKNEAGEDEVFRITRRDECRLMVLHRQSQTIEMFKKDADGNPIEGEYLDFRNILDSLTTRWCSLPVFTVPRRKPTRR